MNPLIVYDGNSIDSYVACWTIPLKTTLDFVSLQEIHSLDLTGRELVFIGATPDPADMKEYRKRTQGILLIDNTQKASDSYPENSSGRIEELCVFRLDSRSWSARKDWSYVQGCYYMDACEGASQANVYALISPGSSLLRLAWSLFNPGLDAPALLEEPIPKQARDPAAEQVAAEIPKSEKAFVLVEQGEELELNRRLRLTRQVEYDGIVYAERGTYARFMGMDSPTAYKICPEGKPLILAVPAYFLEKVMF